MLVVCVSAAERSLVSVLLANTFYVGIGGACLLVLVGGLAVGYCRWSSHARQTLTITRYIPSIGLPFSTSLWVQWIDRQIKGLRACTAFYGSLSQSDRASSAIRNHPTQVNAPCLNFSQRNWCSIYLLRMDGTLNGRWYWLYTEIAYTTLPALSILSSINVLNVTSRNHIDRWINQYIFLHAACNAVALLALTVKHRIFKPSCLISKYSWHNLMFKRNNTRIFQIFPQDCVL